MKFWNVVAGLSIVLVLVYIGFCGMALMQSTATFEEFKQAVLPLVTALLGYMAAMLPKDST